MLAFYAGRLGTVEANATFYRMPKAETLAAWRAEVPATFVFALKAPQRITHVKRLSGADDLVAAFHRAAAELGPALGPVLYQLPPSMKKDLPRLQGFLAALPAGGRAAFEFRHASWLDEAVFSRLRDRNLALCVADSEKMSTPALATADYSYFRLRDEGYQPADLQQWARVVREMPGPRDAFIYFKHEEQGKGPEFARIFMSAL